jgi:membrane-associated phospholipid phosphatase
LFLRGGEASRSRRLCFCLLNGFVIFGLFFALTQLFLYSWTGSLYAIGEGYRLDGLFGELDNKIPFVPQMAVVYLYIYYPWIFISILFFTFFGYEHGLKLGITLFIVGALSTVVYIAFPVSTHWWRQDLLANRLAGNFWAETMYRYYERDTSFNCFPSLHAAVSTVVACSWFRLWKTKKTPLRLSAAIVSILFAAGTVVSTLFVKQHYIADEIAGMALGLAVICSVHRFLPILRSV